MKEYKNILSEQNGAFDLLMKSIVEVRGLLNGHTMKLLVKARKLHNDNIKMLMIKI